MALENQLRVSVYEFQHMVPSSTGLGFSEAEDKNEMSSISVCSEQGMEKPSRSQARMWKEQYRD